MGKPKAKRVLADNEAKAVTRLLRISPRKLNLLAQQIRGKKAETALAELTFSRKRIAAAVKKTLKLDEKVSGDAATVTAKFSLLDDNQPESAREIVWSLKKVGTAWKVADIAAPADDWKLSALDCGTE